MNGVPVKGCSNDAFIDTIVTVMGMRKMENIVPRVGIEPTSLAFQLSVQPLHHIGFSDVTTIPRLPVYASPCLRDQYRLLLLLVLHNCTWCVRSRGVQMMIFHPVLCCGSMSGVVKWCPNDALYTVPCNCMSSVYGEVVSK